jgi:hypothetical protein
MLPGMSVDDLRQSDMMAHLLDALDQGQDIGHYGKLVFAMVARHFLDEDELVGYLTRSPDTSEEDARVLIHQVRGRDYNPPRRERILEWQSEQDFLPDLPDAGRPRHVQRRSRPALSGRRVRGHLLVHEQKEKAANS